MSLRWGAVAALAASVGSGTLAAPIAGEPSIAYAAPARVAEAPHAPSVPHTKAPAKHDDDGDASPTPDAPLLATLVQRHTDERVALDRVSPAQSRFDALMADRVTGSSHALDPRLLGLLRALAARYGGTKAPPRIELVSGFRSPKLNEILRKKGHHVASHSEHSRGHACDFRVVPALASKGIDPHVLEKEIRALGWEGGVGVYTAESDWFVHADVGPNRHWLN